MADEVIRIEFITHYSSYGHDRNLKESDDFLKKLKEAGYLNQRGAGSVAAYRKELQKTHPEIVKITDDLDKLARKKTLSADDVKRQKALQAELRKEKSALGEVVKARAEADRIARKAHKERMSEIAAERREEEAAAKAERKFAEDQERLGTKKSNREAAEARAAAAQHDLNVKHLKEEERVQRNKDREQVAGIERIIGQMRELDNSFERNRKQQTLYQRTTDNLFNKSTRRAISGVHEWATTLASIALPAVPQVLSLIAGALGAIGAAAAGAAASIAKLAPAIGVIGSGITTVVQATSVWKLAMRQFGGTSGIFQSAMFDDLDTFMKKAEDATPVAQKFAITLRTKVKPAIEQFQMTAQRGIFGGLNEAIDAMLPRKGLINQIIANTSGAMGRVIGSFGKELASPQWAKAMKSVGTNNAANIERLGEAAIPTARAFRDLTVAAQPITNWAVKQAQVLSKDFEQFIAGKKASGQLAVGVEGARKRLEQFGHMASNIGSTLNEVMKAATPLGDNMTAGLLDATDAMKAWTKSAEGQVKMRTFFLNMQPTIKETGLLVKDLGASMARVAQQSSIDILVHQLRTDLLPTLEQTMIQVNKAMGPLLVETLVNVMQALASAMGPNGAVTMMVQGVNQLAQAFQKLMELAPGLKQLIGLFGLFRLARLSGVLVGGAGVLRAMQGSRAREAGRLQMAGHQENLRAELGRVYPETMMQPRDPATGRIIKGPRIFDPTRLPPEAQAFRQQLGVAEPTFLGQVLSGREGRQAVRDRFGALREGGMGRFRAGMAVAPGMRGGLAVGGAAALGIGGMVAGEAAGRAGASERVQSVIGMAGMGASLGLGLGMAGGPAAPISMPVGAAIGAVVGGLAGLGMSFLGGKAKVDEFADSISQATTGVKAARDTQQQLAINQRQLQFGVRGGQIELNQAVRARDALTRGMSATEFAKFSKTDVYKSAQLRVDQARVNLSDMKTALDENTKQLQIANEQRKSAESRPRQLFQNITGKYGGQLSAPMATIARLTRTRREQGGTLGAGQQATLDTAIAERDRIRREFAKEMTNASRKAAEAGQPYWARMFEQAINIGATKGFNNLRRKTEQSIRAPATAAVARGARDMPGGRAGGGRINWGSPGSDSAPAMLSPGEFVVTGGGEQMLESMTFPGVLNWLEGNQPPHFARGGRMKHDYVVGRPKGLAVRGNIDILHRPHVWNEAEGGYSSVYSMSNQDPRTGYEVLVPRVVGNKILSGDAAWAHYLATGRNLGQFTSVAAANRYAGALHRQQAGMGGYQKGGRAATGAFARAAYLAPFQGSFEQGFAAGQGRTPNYLASLYGDLVSQGFFEKIDPLTGKKRKKGEKWKDAPLPKNAPEKFRVFQKVLQGLYKAQWVEGGGHAARPGPSKPTAEGLKSLYPKYRKEDLAELAKSNEVRRGMDASGWVRYALSQGGFGDPGPSPRSLHTWGHRGRGKWMGILANDIGSKAWIELGSAWYGKLYGKSAGFGAKEAESKTGDTGDLYAYTKTGFRRGGRFQRGGRRGRRSGWYGGYNKTGVGPHKGGWTESKSAYMEDYDIAAEVRRGRTAFNPLYVDPYVQTRIMLHHPDEGTRGRHFQGGGRMFSFNEKSTRNPAFNKVYMDWLYGGMKGENPMLFDPMPTSNRIPGLKPDSGFGGRGRLINRDIINANLRKFRGTVSSALRSHPDEGTRRFRRGGRSRMFQAGGRVGAMPSVPTVTGAAGDAANKAWANTLMGYMQGLTTATMGGIANAVSTLQERVVGLMAKADTSEKGQNLLARVSAMLDAAEAALGERVGRIAAQIEDMVLAVGKRRGRMERGLALAEIDAGTPRQLAQELTQLRSERFGPGGIGERIAKQRKVLAGVKGTSLEAGAQDALDAMIQEAVDNGLARTLTRRQLVRARQEKPFLEASRAGEGLSFELQKKELTLQRQGVTGDAATAQLRTFMQTQMLPNLKRQEKTAHDAMVKLPKGTQARRDAEDRWRNAVLATLGMQVQIQEDTNKKTGQMVHLTGQLSFDFMGERTTDVIGSGTGM